MLIHGSVQNVIILDSRARMMRRLVARVVEQVRTLPTSRMESASAMRNFISLGKIARRVTLTVQVVILPGSA
jgi:hypothetical protein